MFILPAVVAECLGLVCGGCFSGYVLVVYEFALVGSLVGATGFWVWCLW